MASNQQPRAKTEEYSQSEKECREKSRGEERREMERKGEKRSRNEII